MRKSVVFFVLFIFFIIKPVTFVHSCDLTCQIDQVSAELDKSKEDLKNQSANYDKLSIQLKNIKTTVTALGAQIQKGEKTLAYQKELLNVRTKSYYKNINQSSVSLINFFVADNLSESLRQFFYQKTVVDDDKNAIIKIVLYIKNLETEKARLANLQIEVDRQSQIIAGEIATTKERIATLTTKQQNLIAQRIAALNLSRSAGSAIVCVDDRTLDPGFGTGFAFYTYGIPHRVGLNQYGAKGRADSGQNYETILRAYYNFDELKDADGGIKIRVDGHGEYSLEDYVKRIYEMPADWNMEALKAQAVAARSYALAYTNNGSGSICDSQSCQVFQDNEKGGRWNEAVEATSGKIMIQGGAPIKAWFSSTFGGYAHTSGEVWGGGTSYTKNFADTLSGVGSFSDLNNNSYDKESKCFYTAQGGRAQYNKSAWLMPSEVADIVNTLMLFKKDPSTGSHLYQLDKPNPDGTDNWDENKVKSMLDNPFNNVAEVIANGVDFGGGRTTEITVREGGREEKFSASEFKDRFNLRAPGNISIVGPLFNIEKR